MISLSPGDARGYSLLGQVHKLNGNNSQANRLFRTALRAAPTEINALLNRLQFSAAEGALDETMTRLDVILRRWPKYFENVTPALDALAADRSGATLLRQKLSTQPPWRWHVLLHLLKSKHGLQLVRALLSNEAANGGPVNVDEIAEVIIGLVKRKSYFGAYRTFLLTLTPQEKKALGFVFNDKFRLKSDYRLFNWRVIQTPGADISLPYQAGSQNGGGLAVRFRGTPAKLGNVFQTLSLPAGTFKFSGFATARGLSAPKGLFWEVVCYVSGEQIAAFYIEAGTYQSRGFAQEFKVPEKNCPLQLLRLRTGVVTATWRARYQGTVIVHQVNVVKRP